MANSMQSEKTKQPLSKGFVVLREDSYTSKKTGKKVTVFKGSINHCGENLNFQLDPVIKKVGKKSKEDPDKEEVFYLNISAFAAGGGSMR